MWVHSLNSDPDVIDNVRPMTNEWIMIPACRTCPDGQWPSSEPFALKTLAKIPTICLRGDDAKVSKFSSSGRSSRSCEHPATVVESSSAESYGLDSGSVL